jgi:hypothetical protein
VPRASLAQCGYRWLAAVPQPLPTLHHVAQPGCKPLPSAGFHGVETLREPMSLCIFPVTSRGLAGAPRETPPDRIVHSWQYGAMTHPSPEDARIDPATHSGQHLFPECLVSCDSQPWLHSRVREKELELGRGLLSPDVQDSPRPEKAGVARARASAFLAVSFIASSEGHFSVKRPECFA